MKNSLKILFFLILSVTLSLNAQETSRALLKNVRFKASPTQKYGFDASDKQTNNRIYYKSVESKATDLVEFVISTEIKKNLVYLKFKTSKDIEISYSLSKDSVCVIQLPSKEKSYQIHAFYKEEKIATLEIEVFQRKIEKCILVPLTNSKIDFKKLQNEVNSILNPALTHVDFEIKKPFHSRVFPDTMKWSNPSDSMAIFTGQMRLLRNLYFKENPAADKKAYYIFLIPGFIDTLFQEFTLPNKSLAFISSNVSEEELSVSIVKCLLASIGYDDKAKLTSLNSLELNQAISINHFEWEAFQLVPRGFSWYDDREYVKTNNGSVAYYTWKEDKQGNIILNGESFLNAIKRPFKHNFLSYRFDVKYSFLTPLFKWDKFYISSLNFLFLVLIATAYFFLFKIVHLFWKKQKKKYKIPKFILYSLISISIIFLSYGSLFAGNSILDYFKQVSGPIKEFDGFSADKVRYNLLNNNQLKHEDAGQNVSEILIEKKGKWEIKKRKSVLYFEVKKDKKDSWNVLRFLGNKDSLILINIDYAEKANTHYIVFNYTEEDGTILKQQVYNHGGDFINSKIPLDDIPKRIVLFVNGYRPTSIGKTFEENFQDIKKKGLENPNSKNLIYNFDRYNYWEQWGQINLLFQNRLNPNVSYYADGHFSVSSSNFRSLVNFTTISSLYPKQCSNLKKHTCFRMSNPSWMQLMIGETSTYDQLDMYSNRSGFNYRKNKGRIAGKNLLQILNEVPRLSKNDTLYLVAHSMGFAYATGMIESLRGSIQFGSFYIIAPENAKAGSVIVSEWKDVWQYGSNLDQEKRDAPCLQDGVAPQTQVKGLSFENRIFIPKEQARKKGFFDSHFIGYYRWILDIQPDSKGYIPQR